MAKKKEEEEYRNPKKQPALEWLKEKLGVEGQVGRSQNKKETDQLKDSEGTTPFRKAEEDAGTKRNELRTLRQSQEDEYDRTEKARRRKYYGD